MTEAGIFQITAGNDCGIVYDTMTVHMLPAIPLLNLGADTMLCDDEVLQLVNPFPDEQIMWHTGAQTDTILVHAGDIVYATLTGVCGQSHDTLFVNALPALPDLDLGMDQGLCPGETIVIDPGSRM